MLYTVVNGLSMVAILLSLDNGNTQEDSFWVSTIGIVLRLFAYACIAMVFGYQIMATCDASWSGQSGSSFNPNWSYSCRYSFFLLFCLAVFASSMISVYGYNTPPSPRRAENFRVEYHDDTNESDEDARMEMSDYEKLRQDRVARNAERLKALGLA